MTGLRHKEWNADMMLKSPRRTHTALSPALRRAALDFARADLRWRTLGADQAQWTDPDKQRGLAAAFLHYHAAKLALESALPPSESVMER